MGNHHHRSFFFVLFCFVLFFFFWFDTVSYPGIQILSLGGGGGSVCFFAQNFFCHFMK